MNHLPRHLDTLSSCLGPKPLAVVLVLSGILDPNHIQPTRPEMAEEHAAVVRSAFDPRRVGRLGTGNVARDWLVDQQASRGQARRSFRRPS